MTHVVRSRIGNGLAVVELVVVLFANVVCSDGFLGSIVLFLSGTLASEGSGPYCCPTSGTSVVSLTAVLIDDMPRDLGPGPAIAKSRLAIGSPFMSCDMLSGMASD